MQSLRTSITVDVFKSIHSLRFVKASTNGEAPKALRSTKRQVRQQPHRQLTEENISFQSNSQQPRAPTSTACLGRRTASLFGWPLCFAWCLPHDYFTAEQICMV